MQIVVKRKTKLPETEIRQRVATYSKIASKLMDRERPSYGDFAAADKSIIRANRMTLNLPLRV